MRAYDLVTSPAYMVLSAKDRFDHPTRRVNELWQTDFTYFKIIGWGWYYLSTVLDDYCLYIITWSLRSSMAAEDVQETLDQALTVTDLGHAQVRSRPRLLSVSSGALKPTSVQPLSAIRLHLDCGRQRGSSAQQASAA